MVLPIFQKKMNVLKIINPICFPFSTVILILVFLTGVIIYTRFNIRKNSLLPFSTDHNNWFVSFHDYHWNFFCIIH